MGLIFARHVRCLGRTGGGEAGGGHCRCLSTGGCPPTSGGSTMAVPRTWLPSGASSPLNFHIKSWSFLKKERILKYMYF